MFYAGNFISTIDQAQKLGSIKTLLSIKILQNYRKSSLSSYGFKVFDSTTSQSSVSARSAGGVQSCKHTNLAIITQYKLTFTTHLPKETYLYYMRIFLLEHKLINKGKKATFYWKLDKY